MLRSRAWVHQYSRAGLTRCSSRKEILDLSAKSSRSDAGSGAKFGKKREGWTPGSVAMLVIPATAFGLGCWQTRRLQWKLDLIKHLESRLNEPAIDFPSHDLSLMDDMEYRRVKLRGRFLHDREFVLSPRGRFDPGAKDDSKGSMLSSNDMSSHGGHVITPFALAGSNIVILVNRGWVEQSRADPRLRKGSSPSGEVTLEAIVRKTEKRPQFVGKNIPERGVWFFKDVHEMARHYNTDPIYVEAVYESTLPGGPIGGQTNINVRNEHLNYLLTWFSLCAATTAMWYVRFMKR